jgi:hypothetical protein
MKHCRQISKNPGLAQVGICTDIVGNSQAVLCFMLEFLTGFLLPVIEIKGPEQRGDNTIPVPTE